MTITDLKSLIDYPYRNSFGSLVNLTLGSATAKGGMIFQAPKTGVLSKVGFRTATTANAGNVYRIRIETVTTGTSTTGGLPSGTLHTVGAEATLTGTAVNTNYEVTLGTPCNVTKGEWLAVVITVDTFVASSTFWRLAEDNYQANSPYSVAATTGGYSKVGAQNPNFAVMVDGAWASLLPGLPAVAAITETPMTTTNNVEMGNRFVLPFGGRVSGFWINTLAGSAATVTLYDMSDTVLASISTTGESVVTAGSNNSFQLASPVELPAGFEGRIATQANTTTAVAARSYSIPSTDYQSALPGGSSIMYSSRVGSGAWTDNNLKRLLIGLTFDGIDTGAVNNRKVKVGGTFVAA